MTVRQYVKTGRLVRAVCTWYGVVWDESRGEMWEVLLMQEIKCVSDENIVFRKRAKNPPRAVRA